MRTLTGVTNKGRHSCRHLCLMILALFLTACSHEPRIRVGSKNFSEQLVLGEIVAQHLENRLHGHVSRKLDLGGTLLAQQAIVAGDIDVYPEYTGTALTAVLKEKPLKDPAKVLTEVRRGYAQWHLEWLEPLGFENTFAMAVRREDGGYATLTRAAVARAWKLGVGYEFAHREDGLPGLMRTYGLRLAGSPKTMDLGLLYQALSKHQVDMVAGNSTDGLLSLLPITVLKDDRRYFPPYECALIVREAAEREFPALRPALAELSGKINSDTMRRLNYELDGKHRPAREIARNFLAAAGLR
ncbi:MAG TPA: glycine betaine ABC transporter substrate-binding protein [Bryobacteraceae bacterium]|nr:glycine betaine ABC transporter substrate-binding protein [Bryobacteraceae bacterium]